MNFKEFKKVFDESFAKVTPEEFVAEMEALGYKFVLIKCKYCGAKNDNGKVLCNICECKGVDGYKL